MIIKDREEKAREKEERRRMKGEEVYMAKFLEDEKAWRKYWSMQWRRWRTRLSRRERSRRMKCTSRQRRKRKIDCSEIAVIDFIRLLLFVKNKNGIKERE